MSSSITETEILDAIRSAMATTEDPTGAFTVVELGTLMRSSDLTVRRHLRLLMARGRIEAVRVTRQYLDGRTGPVPAYRLIPSPPKPRGRARRR